MRNLAHAVEAACQADSVNDLDALEGSARFAVECIEAFIRLKREMTRFRLVVPQFPNNPAIEAEVNRLHDLRLKCVDENFTQIVDWLKRIRSAIAQEGEVVESGYKPDLVLNFVPVAARENDTVASMKSLIGMFRAQSKGVGCLVLLACLSALTVACGCNERGPWPNSKLQQSTASSVASMVASP